MTHPSAGIEVVAAKPAAARLQSPRLNSVDLLRGLIMVIMALDHTRDFYSNIPFRPEDLSRTYSALFFTRFVTHFCAPVFFLLAGTGASLAVSRGTTVSEISRFLWTRGLWLVFLELTVLAFGWSFVLFGLGGVVWALGWSMVALALIVWLPVPWIAALGVVMIAAHNLFDGIAPDSLEEFAGLWRILHSPGPYQITSGVTLLVLYPLVPWIGVMACGYALGTLLLRQDRRKLLLGLGAALTLAFFILRGINHYGNGTAGYPFSIGPWRAQPSLSLTVISFFNTLKYPPSLDFLLMTLGPSLMLLAWFDGATDKSGWARILLIYGRVPMFYYILHIYLLHVMAIALAWTLHQPYAWLLHGGFFLSRVPEDYGHGLPFVYFMWVVTVALLYLPCRWFMEYKTRHRDWNWLSYV